MVPKKSQNLEINTENLGNVNTYILMNKNVYSHTFSKSLILSTDSSFEFASHNF